MCTGIRFSDNNHNMYFGRNLDWTKGYGEKVVITPSGYKYNSAFLGEIESKNGAIIGMAITVENAPLYFDCANESGLAIAGLNFPGYTKFENTAVDGKTNVAQYEFPLWITMNFSSVDETEEALRNTAIVAKPINDQFPVSELHYLISDKNRSIVVEYTQNGMEFFSNDTDVLTNAPGFLEQLKNLTDDPKALPAGWDPSARFARAAYLNKHYPPKTNEDENILRLFHTLSSVAMIDGAVPKESGFEKTIYTSGYSTASRTYYYNTYNNPTIIHASLDDYDLTKTELIEI